MTLDELNALPADRAADELRSCCGASRWVQPMVERRPYASLDALFAMADETWFRLGPDDWHEAFAHHPRIGEQRPAPRQDGRAAGWSANEQAKVATASESVQEQLAEVNRQYEAKFGHIYIVCAAGRSAEDLLAVARERLHNDPSTELRIAAEEQRKITRLRLQKLFSERS